jgi:hypothetical protein
VYLWNVKALARDLKEDKVTEKGQMKYFLLFSLLISCALFSSTADGSHWKNPALGWVDLGAKLIISFFGIIWCFKTNEQGDNKHFVVRMLCLGLPIAIRLLAAYNLFLVILAVIMVFGFNVKGFSYTGDLPELGVLIILGICNYVFLRNYMAFVSRNENGWKED